MNNLCHLSSTSVPRSANAILERRDVNTERNCTDETVPFDAWLMDNPELVAVTLVDVISPTH